MEYGDILNDVKHDLSLLVAYKIRLNAVLFNGKVNGTKSGALHLSWLKWI